MAANAFDILAGIAFRRAFAKRGEKDVLSLPRSVAKLQARAREFADREIRPRALKADAKNRDEFDWEIAAIGAREGWLSILVPSFIGGDYSIGMMRYGTLGPAVMIEEFCKACSGIGLIFGVNALGIAPIMLTMNFRLWKKYLTPLIETWKTDRPDFAAFAITEPGAGSDAEDTPGGMRAKLSCFATKVTGGWKLNGRKCFISSGSVAKLFTVFACVEREERVKAWTCFIVRAGQTGFTVGRVEDKMGQRASPAAELIFEDVFVSDDDVIGGVKGGWDLNTFTLDTSRGPVGAIALGIAEGAYDRTFNYCMSNKRQGITMIEHGWIRQSLAEMAAKIEAARSLVYRACSVMPSSGKLSAMAKTFSSDMSVEVCAKCIEILGPEGLERENFVEKQFRDAKLCQIYEGTNQVNRLRIMDDLETEYRKLPAIR